MKIDWFTILAQAFNFLVLVWLMKRFLYKPIRYAIDEREKRIATELANADKMRFTAQKQSDDLKQKNLEFDQLRAVLLSKATSEAQVERERLLNEARTVAAALSLKQQERLKNEEHNLHQAIGLRTQKEVFSIARKVLTDLAGISLEERVVEVFIQRLHELTDEKRTLLKSELTSAVAKASSTHVVVRTSLNLQSSQHLAIETAVKKLIGNETRFQFESAPDLISGIELTINGQKIAWSIADYLRSLEKGVGELLNEDDKFRSEAKAVPEIKTASNPEENKVEAKSQ